MIRKSIALKISLYIIILVLSVLVVLYLSLAQLLNNFSIRTNMKGFQDLFMGVIHYGDWLFLLAGMGAVFFAAGMAVILSSRMARPLIRMEAATKNIAAGKYETRVEVAGEDEVARLGRAINHLASSLEHLDTSRRHFLADVSHELRTPLSYIRGYSQVIADGLAASEEERQRYLKIIRDESERVEKLIDDLFILAQADDGFLRIEKVRVDFMDLAERTVAHVLPRAQEKQLDVTLQGERPVIAWLDERRLEQVLYNLLENAIRYTSVGGAITVHVLVQREWMRVDVVDTGVGIAAGELPYIWDRLYRVEKSRSRAAGGTGLGLAIVKKIIEVHGGRVNAVSQEGKGTTMSFWLPVRDPLPEEVSPL